MGVLPLPLPLAIGVLIPPPLVLQIAYNYTYCNLLLYWNVLDCTVLYCTVLYCTVLYCTGLPDSSTVSCPSSSWSCLCTPFRVWKTWTSWRMEVIHSITWPWRVLRLRLRSRCRWSETRTPAPGSLGRSLNEGIAIRFRDIRNGKGWWRGTEPCRR